jgi:hypothetical protein
MPEVAIALAEAIGEHAPVNLKALASATHEEARQEDVFNRMITVAGGRTNIAPAAAATVAAKGAPDFSDTRAPAMPSPQATLVTVPPAPPMPSMASPAASPDAPRPGFQLVDGPSEQIVWPQGSPAQTSFALGPRTTFGRISENDVVLRDVSVSRYHAVMLHEGDSWFLEDANSGNGSSVNGNPVLERTRVRDGDEIQLGIFRFRFLAE